MPQIVHTRHHRFQEIIPRRTTPAPFRPGHRTTAMDIRPLQASGLRRNTLATHLPRRCHRRPDVPDQLHEIHLHRHLPRNLTGTSPPDNPTRYGHIMCPPPGEFASSDFNDWSAEEGGVGSSYLPSAFVGQPVGIDQVDDVWIGASGATTRTVRNADLVYNTRPPSPIDPRLFWETAR